MVTGSRAAGVLETSQFLLYVGCVVVAYALRVWMFGKNLPAD